MEAKKTPSEQEDLALIQVKMDDPISSKDLNLKTEEHQDNKVSQVSTLIAICFI